MKRIMTKSNNRYTQTLEIGDKVNKVTYAEYGEILYEGVAHNIVDTGNILSFTDPTGKKYRFIKYFTNSTAT